MTSAVRHLLAAAGLVATVASWTGTPAYSQDAAEYFKGRTVTIIVGFDAGGGYANYCRQLIEHWSKHTPGNPSFICQYMPGGGGVKATNYLENVASKDGSILGMISDYVALAQLLEPNKVKYDVRKFKWVGIMVPANPALMVRKGAKVQKFDDMFKDELIVGLVGVLAQDGINCRLMNNFLGTKMKLVAGYNATAKISLAMEKGEVDASLSSWISWKSRAKSQIESGQYIPIAQIGFKKAWDLPNVPLVSEYAKTDEAKQVLDLVAASAPFGRSISVPPGYPAPLLAALRASFMTTMKDPQFLESAKKRDIEIDPSSGEEIEPILQKIMATPPAIIEKFRESAGIKS